MSVEGGIGQDDTAVEGVSIEEAKPVEVVNKPPHTDVDWCHAFRCIAHQAYENSRNKGFWKDGDKRNKFEMLMLMVCELAEGAEALRKPGPSEHIPDFTAEEEEIADAIIRLMDYSAGWKMRTCEAVLAKMHFNLSRPHMHGKKC